MSRGDKIEPQTDSASIKSKRGPPFKLEIDEEVINRIERLAGLGLTQKDISLVLGITEKSIHNYKKRIPDIATAIEKGKSVAKSAIAQALYKKALEGDTVALKWIETTRYGYSEKIKTESEHTIKTESFESFLKRTKEKNVNEKEIIPSITDSSDSSSGNIQDGEGSAGDKS